MACTLVPRQGYFKFVFFFVALASLYCLFFLTHGSATGERTVGWSFSEPSPGIDVDIECPELRPDTTPHVTASESGPGGYIAAPSVFDVDFQRLDSGDATDYREWNAQVTRDLTACVLMKNCGRNQRKVALLAANWFQEAVFGGFRGGEGVWAFSVFKHLRAMGYTLLFSQTFEETALQYRTMPDLVKVVIRNRPALCQRDPKCVKSTSNPLGIPAWKLFDFEFYPSPEGKHMDATLLGGKWILAANPDKTVYRGAESKIQYIGYSIEDECHAIPVVPLAERKDQAWLLMKEIVYAYDNNFAWERSYFSDAAQDIRQSSVSAEHASPRDSFQFVGAWQLHQHFGWDPETQGVMQDFEDRVRGVVNLANDVPQTEGEDKKQRKLSSAEFVHEVGQSRMMVGVGGPWWSPSPYNALCQGVPFLNPIIHWDESHPEERRKWYTQHPSLDVYDPPYVYNVHAKNYTAFVEAVRMATSTEIGRFIPEHMTEAAVRNRLKIFMETDWRVRAEVLLQARIDSGDKDVYIFDL